MQHRADSGLWAVIVLIGFGLAGPVLAREADAAASKLPDGEGKQVVLELCAGACHSSDRILNAHKSPAEWKQTVLQMVSNGAQLFPEDVDTVTKYLSDHLSNAAPADK